MRKVAFILAVFMLIGSIIPNTFSFGFRSSLSDDQKSRIEDLRDEFREDMSDLRDELRDADSNEEREDIRDEMWELAKEFRSDMEDILD